MKNKKIKNIFEKYIIYKNQKIPKSIIIKSQELLEIKDYIRQLEIENADVISKYNRIAYKAANLLSDYSVGCPSEEKRLKCTIDSTTCLNCWMHELKKL